MKFSKKLKNKFNTFKRWFRRPRRWRKIFALGFCIFFVWAFFLYLWLPSGAEFRNANPTTTAIIQERIEQAQDSGRKLVIKQKWVPLAAMPKSLIRAVLVAEDFNFFSHSGFDLREIVSAFLDIFRKLKLPRGASTITQQLAKNLYLSSSRSPIRKFKEAIITIRLERNLSKKRILEIYLNFIELGDGIFGVEAASQHYFKKSVQGLSEREAAYLAAIIPAPKTTFNPLKNPQRVTKRQNILQRRMNKIVLPGD